MAHQPVGDTITLTTGTTSTRDQFTVQSDTLRVVPTGNNVHVAIGTTATAGLSASTLSVAFANSWFFIESLISDGDSSAITKFINSSMR